MDRQMLYKAGNLSSKSNKADEKFLRLKNERKTKRNDAFNETRNITTKPLITQEVSTDTKIVNRKPLNPNEMYRRKYLDWKAEQERKKKEKKSKPPFIAVVNKNDRPSEFKFDNYTCQHNKNKENYCYKMCVTSNSAIVKNKKVQQIKKSPILKKSANSKTIPSINIERNKINTKSVRDKINSTKNLSSHPKIQFKNVNKNSKKISLKSVNEKMSLQKNKPKNVKTNNCKTSIIIEPIQETGSGKDHLEANLCSPEKTGESNSLNYLSPFVTTSRGKVSAKKEHEKRQNTYKLENTSTELSVETKRALESVKYFRKILDDEIRRLHDKCAIWEEYQTQNMDKIQNDGEDMINVTVGQTKLLTSKKLQQFRGLIDECEETALKVETSRKPIYPEDLEGFWSMVYLQIENVEKRFNNLDRWKSNDWNDPDEVKTTKKMVNADPTKVLKRRVPKSVTPNRTIKYLLRNAQYAYKKRKLEEGENNDTIFVTSKRTSSHIFGTPPIKNTPDRSSNTRKRLSKSLDGFITKNKSEEVFPAPLNGILENRKSTALSMSMPYNPTSISSVSEKPFVGVKKSILKTPGIESKRKTVFFNDEPQYKSPISFLTSLDQTPDQSINERSLRLRSRKIYLRTDLDIEIPI